MSDPTIQLVKLALDAALMRETAIANNVANTNTKGYQTIGVNFEAQLNDLSSGQNDTLTSALDNIQPSYEAIPYSSLDEQMALSVKNATQYRALIKGINHKLAIMALAVQGNNAS